MSRDARDEQKTVIFDIAWSARPRKTRVSTCLRIRKTRCIAVFVLSDNGFLKIYIFQTLFVFIFLNIIFFFFNNNPKYINRSDKTFELKNIYIKKNIYIL